MAHIWAHQLHCYTLLYTDTLLPEIINCQWMGSRLERCNILTSDLAFRIIAGPLLPLERSRTLDNFCQGTVGSDINSIIVCEADLYILMLYVS